MLLIDSDSFLFLRTATLCPRGQHDPKKLSSIFRQNWLCSEVISPSTLISCERKFNFLLISVFSRLRLFFVFVYCWLMSARAPWHKDKSSLFGQNRPCSEVISLLTLMLYERKFNFLSIYVFIRLRLFFIFKKFDLKYRYARHTNMS